ncbi:MAG TPA: RodZ domain-containing protein [Actinomycetota bacterium]
MAVSVSPKAGVGGTLRQARRELGLTLEEIALRTRIHPRYLRALEHDAPPGSFKAPIYARAFLREYATCIGLDPEPLVEAYRTAHHMQEPLRLVPSPPARDRRWPRRAGLAAAAALLLAGATALAFTLQLDLARPARPTIAPPVADPTATGGGGSIGYHGVVLEVKVRNAPALVRVTRGGDVLLEATKEPGWSRTFRAPRRLDVWTRNAGAVVFTLNGERVGALGDYGERARGAFAWEQGEARQLRG